MPLIDLNGADDWYDYEAPVVGINAKIQPRNLFAQPELEEVIVTARTLAGRIDVEPIVPKGIAPGALGESIAVASRYINPLLLLTVGGNTGPRGTGELQPDMVPWEPELLPEVVVNAPPVGPPSYTLPGYAEPQLPPNWNDLVQWPGPPGGPLYTFPLPGDGFSDYLDFRDNPAPRQPDVLPGPTRSPEIVDFPSGPEMQPAPERKRQPDAAPGSPAPDVLSPPWEFPLPRPTRDPDPFAIPPGDPGEAPNRDPDTLDDPFEDPFVVPAFPDPNLLPGQPSNPLDPGLDPHDPGQFFRPDPGQDRDLDPFPDPFTPQPPKDADACDCDKKPKKKKKKPEDRTICYKGTYRQLKRGISYQRGEEVPCDSKAPARSKVKKPRTKKPKDLGDLADIIFNRS